MRRRDDPCRCSWRRPERPRGGRERQSFYSSTNSNACPRCSSPYGWPHLTEARSARSHARRWARPCATCADSPVSPNRTPSGASDSPKSVPAMRRPLDQRSRNSLGMKTPTPSEARRSGLPVRRAHAVGCATASARKWPSCAPPRVVARAWPPERSLRASSGKYPGSHVHTPERQRSGSALRATRAR